LPGFPGHGGTPGGAPRAPGNLTRTAMPGPTAQLMCYLPKSVDCHQSKSRLALPSERTT
jgi:hypothetical protein